MRAPFIRLKELPHTLEQLTAVLDQTSKQYYRRCGKTAKFIILSTKIRSQPSCFANKWLNSSKNTLSQVAWDLLALGSWLEELMKNWDPRSTRLRQAVLSTVGKQPQWAKGAATADSYWRRGSQMTLTLRTPSTLPSWLWGKLMKAKWLRRTSRLESSGHLILWRSSKFCLLLRLKTTWKK